MPLTDANVDIQERMKKAYIIMSLPAFPRRKKKSHDSFSVTWSVPWISVFRFGFRNTRSCICIRSGEFTISDPSFSPKEQRLDTMNGLVKGVAA